MNTLLIEFSNIISIVVGVGGVLAVLALFVVALLYLPKSKETFTVDQVSAFTPNHLIKHDLLTAAFMKQFFPLATVNFQLFQNGIVVKDVGAGGSRKVNIQKRSDEIVQVRSVSLSESLFSGFTNRYVSLRHLFCLEFRGSDGVIRKVYLAAQQHQKVEREQWLAAFSSLGVPVRR